MAETNAAAPSGPSKLFHRSSCAQENTRAGTESWAGTMSMGRGACRREWMGWSWGWAGLRRTIVREAIAGRICAMLLAPFA